MLLTDVSGIHTYFISLCVQEGNMSETSQDGKGIRISTDCRSPVIKHYSCIYLYIYRLTPPAVASRTEKQAEQLMRHLVSLRSDKTLQSCCSRLNSLFVQRGWIFQEKEAIAVVMLVNDGV